MWGRYGAFRVGTIAIILLYCSSLSAAGAANPVSHYERPVGRKGPFKNRVIVFVHGMFSNSTDAWTSSNGAYWPRLILNDDAFNGSDIYVANYVSPMFGNSMTVDEIVTNLNNRFTADGIFSKHREVVFVCHSLGGIIIQQFLVTYQKQYGDKVPFVYFFAVPEEGSQIAVIAKVFSQNRTLDAVFHGNENTYLPALESQWRAARLKVHRYCAYETRQTKGFTVVDRLSGTRSCDEPAIPINEDHLNIVKPNSTNHDSYVALRNAILDNWPAPKSGVPEKKPPLNSQGDGRKTNIDSTSAIGMLSSLGWQVQPVVGTTLQFQDTGMHISLRKSAPYFCALSQPFNVNIVSAQTLDGMEGLGAAKHLMRVELNSAEVSDISQLKYLRNIRALIVGQTRAPLSDLTPLQSLTQLEELGLDSTAIHDLTPIQNLTRLTTLSIGGTRVTDLSPLRNLHHLQSLNLGGTPVSNLSPLADIQLTKLFMSAEQLPILYTLPRKQSLTTIEIYETTNAVVDLSPIAQFSNIQALELNLFDAPFPTNISVLGNLKELTELHIVGNEFQYATQLTGLDAIGELPHLTKLSLLGIQLTDLNFLGGLNNMKELTVVNTSLNNVSVLSRLTSLEKVCLNGTLVVDISPLLNLPHLIELDVARTPSRADVLTQLEQRGVKIIR